MNKQAELAVALQSQLPTITISEIRRKLGCCCPELIEKLCSILRIPKDHQEILVEYFCDRVQENHLADQYYLSRSTIQRRKKRALSMIYQAITRPRFFDPAAQSLIQAIFLLLAFSLLLPFFSY